MHEMSIAMNIVDIAVENANKEKAAKINKIELEIGTLAGVVSEALEFCFQAACKGTIAEKARLEIVKTPAIAVCEACGHSFEADQIVSECPECKSIVSNVSGGRELKIKSINID